MATTSLIRSPRRAPTWAPTRVHATLGLVGVALGLTAGVAAAQYWNSWLLGLAVCVFVTYTVGRTAPEIIVGPERLRRGILFGIWPATCATALGLTYAAWGSAWLATLVALAVAFVASEAAARTVFRGIRLEEETKALDLALRVTDRTR